MPQVSPVVAVMQKVGISDEQIANLLKELIPAARGLDSFEVILTRFAERCAGNGLTADMAGAFAVALSEFDVPGPYQELVGEIADHFHAGPVSKTEAASFSRRALALLAEQRQPDPTGETALVPVSAGPIVEATARPVDGPTPPGE